MAVLLTAMSAAHEVNTLVHCSQSEHLVHFWNGLCRFVGRMRISKGRLVISKK